MIPGLLFEQGCLGFLEAVKSIGCVGVLGLVRMNKEGFLAVLDFDVGVWDTWLEVQDGVGIEAECGKDAGYFGILDCV